MVMATILSRSPAVAICFIFIWPLAKTIAFGGVEIGIINAQLEAIVAGITNNSGGISRLVPIPITTGKNIVTKATLLITSVKKSTKDVIMTTIKIKSRCV